MRVRGKGAADGIGAYRDSRSAHGPTRLTAPVATASIIFTLIENLPSPFDEHTGTARPASPPPAELLPRIALESFAASDSARADELESAAPADALA